MDIFVESVYYWNQYWCINVGFELGDVDILFQSAFSFYDCYKNFILAYCDYSNWIGPDAKLIDSCEESDTETLTVYEYTYDTRTWYWGNRGTPETCWPGYLGPHHYRISQYFLQNAMDYIKINK